MIHHTRASETATRGTARNMKDDSTPATSHDDDLGDAIIAADDTGMISGERLITIAEIEEAESESNDAGNV
jgi:hypothetical protein